MLHQAHTVYGDTVKCYLTCLKVSRKKYTYKQISSYLPARKNGGHWLFQDALNLQGFPSLTPVKQRREGALLHF